MNNRKYLPIDLPSECTYLIRNFDDKTRSKIDDMTQNALTEGRWGRCENIRFDVTNLEFIAYWIQKTRGPLKHAMKGFGIEEKLSPYKKTWLDFTTDGFQIEKSYRFSATGDLMFAKYLEESKDNLYKAVDDLIFGADYSYSNLESTLTKDPIKECGIDKRVWYR